MADSDREEIESYALSEFAKLVDLHGFSDPSLDKGQAYSSFLWQFGDVAVELSFDWRDRIVSALLVNASSTSKGAEKKQQKSKYIYMIFKEQGWGTFGRATPEEIYLSTDSMKHELSKMRADILAHIEDIKRKGANLL